MIKSSNQKKKEQQQQQAEAEENKSAADNISMAGSVTTVAKSKSGAVHKHCLLGNCGGKRLGGTNWAPHMKSMHPGEDGKKEGVAFDRCTGDSCALCA